MDLVLEFNKTENVKCESENVNQFSRELRVKELASVITTTISTNKKK